VVLGLRDSTCDLLLLWQSHHQQHTGHHVWRCPWWQPVCFLEAIFYIIILLIGRSVTYNYKKLCLCCSLPFKQDPFVYWHPFEYCSVCCSPLRCTTAYVHNLMFFGLHLSNVFRLGSGCKYYIASSLWELARCLITRVNVFWKILNIYRNKKKRKAIKEANSAYSFEK